MIKVFSLSQLPAGHMHQVTVGDYDVLLANVAGEVYAVENKCSHYNFALSKGSLCEHRVRCPLHHACFDVRTGEQLEAPGMDGIARFEVQVREEEIWVSDRPVVTNEPTEKQVPTQKGADGYTYAIVGGGTAAAYAVESIRAEDKEGSIVVFSEESAPPYDRTKVSKAYMQGDAEATSLPLRDFEFYDQHGVDFRAGTRVQRVDVAAGSISLEGGSTVTYDRLLLASGATPRRLEVPGSDLDGIHTVRKIADATAAREAVTDGTRVVIIGGSFIGLESAMSLGKRGGDITVVTSDEILFKQVFGERVGKYVQRLHEDAGVKFEFGSKAREIHGNGRVASVTLDNGRELPAEVVIVGIGVQPATDYLVGLAARNDGSITVDGHLAAHADHVWAAGDIATYPDREGMLRIEHWKVAGQQGRTAGRNMAGTAEPYHMVPFFWSNQQGINFRYVGHGTDYDRIVFDGNPGEGPFLAFYVKDKHVQAVLGVKRDADTAAINELMGLGKMPSADRLTDRDWLGLCRAI